MELILELATPDALATRAIAIRVTLGGDQTSDT